jgi:exopolysaccharide production protein ExoZ
MGHTEPSRNDGLQVGRALAALSVAYFHSYIALRAFPGDSIHPFAPLAEGGFFGVNFFFAISGYVIAVVTDRPDFTVRPFLIKRFFRLYPLVILFCLFQYALHVARIVDVTADHSWSRILYGMSLLPGSGERYYAVTWTLEQEVIFYLAAALIVPWFGRMSLAALLMVPAGITWYLQLSSDGAHILTMAHADFAAGLAVYQFRRPLSRVGALLPLLGAPVAYWLAFRGYGAWGTSIGSFLALLGCSNLQLEWKQWPQRALVEIGDASYSIYLSHWILLYLSNRLAQGLRIDPSLAEAWRFATLGAIVMVSVLLWRGFEKPINKFGRHVCAFGKDQTPPQRVGRGEIQLIRD